MPDELDFDAATYLATPVKDRVRLCKLSAARVEELADKRPPKYRASYLEIANEWLRFARDMERTGQGA